MTVRVQCPKCFQNFQLVTGAGTLTPVGSLAPDEEGGT